MPEWHRKTRTRRYFSSRSGRGAGSLALLGLATALALGTAAARAESAPASTARAPRASAAAAAAGFTHGVAVIYHQPGDTGQAYYTVHNGLFLAEKRIGSKLIGVKVAHVAKWDPNATKFPHVDAFWVCFNPVSASCPSPKMTSWFLRKVSRYPASKGSANTGPTIAFHGIAGSDKTAKTHNGAFVCWKPKGKGCGPWPGDSKLINLHGTLVVLHFVNFKTGGRHAAKDRLSFFRFERETVKDPVSAQRTSYLCRKEAAC